MFLGPGKGSEVVILVPAAVARPMRYISLRTAGRRFAGAPGEHLDDCSRAEVRCGLRRLLIGWHELQFLGQGKVIFSGTPSSGLTDAPPRRLVVR